MQTVEKAAINVILRLEREMTYVQSQKIKAIDALNRYRLERQKAETVGRASDVVADWINAVISNTEEPGNDTGRH